MTNNRLQEIKSYFKKIIDEKRNVNPHLNADDITFLIGQAERVQDLEKKVENERKHKLTYRKVAQRYKNERSCHRKALEFYADKENYEMTIHGVGVLTESEIMKDAGKKARQELEVD